MKQRCVDAVEAAVGRRMNKAEIKNIEQKIIEAKKQLARSDREKWLQMSGSEQLLAAAKQVGMNALADVKRKNMIFAQDTLTQNQRIAELTHPELAASDVIDRMIAHYSDMSGIKSIDTWSRTVANEANGVLYEFYASAKGDLRIFTDKKLMDDVVREIYKEPTGDIKARSIAEKLDFVLDNMLRQRFNRAGGDIGQVEGGYIPTQWSSERVKAEGEAAWLNDAKQNIDRASLVHADGQLYSDLEVEAFIKAAFETIESDGVNKLEPGRQGLSGGSKVTNRHSQSRVLHWKDADAWLFMQDKYGAMPLVNLIEMHVRAMAKDIALVERLGSNPRKAMELLQGHAKIIDKANGVSAKAMKKKLRRADVMFDALMGKDTVPENQVLNNIGVTYRSINVGSLLGSALLSSIPDVAAMSSLARMHGLSQQKMFGELLTQLNPADKEHRQQAAELGLAVDEMIGSITRWGDDGLTDVYSRSSKIARGASTIAAQTMRLAIMNAWSASTKRGYSKLMMNKYGEATRFKSWDDLHPKDRELMLKTGLDERIWEVMQIAEPVDDGKGNKLMSGYSIRQMTDEQILSANDADLKVLINKIDSEIAELNSRNQVDDDRITAKAQLTEDVKQQLSQHLQDYANRKDAKSRAEKQALQDRIDLLDAQKESAAALADMNAYIRTVENQDALKSFMDNITQGKQIDQIAAKSEKLGKELQKIDNRFNLQSKQVSKHIASFENEIQAKFKDFSELLINKKMTAEKLAEYESKLAERLNTYSSSRDVQVQREIEAFNKLKDLSVAKQEQLSKSVEIDRAVAQTKMKNKTDAKIDSSIERNARKDYRSGESIGQRIGSSERRIVELRAKMRNADSEVNKAITKKFNDLDQRVKTIDDEYVAYVAKVNERQLKRTQVIERLDKSIDAEKKQLANRLRDEFATQFQAHVLDEQGLAVVEAGLREHTKMYSRTTGGDIGGFFLRNLFQFKSFPVAVLMRHVPRMLAQNSFLDKAAYAIPLFTGMTLLGGLAVQLSELALGNDPLTMWDSNDPQKTTEFWLKSVVKGGGLGILGDIVASGTNSYGRTAVESIAGPMVSDINSVAGLTVGNMSQWYRDQDTHASYEALKFLKNKVPAQNLFYTRAAMQRMILNDMQDSLAPGYRLRLQRKAERDHGRTQWWGDDLSDVQMPDFERVVQ